MPKLLDGSEVASDSEEWRHFCEARSVLKMPTLLDRRSYLASVEQKRGAQTRIKIEGTMLEIHKAGKV